MNRKKRFLILFVILSMMLTVTVYGQEENTSEEYTPWDQYEDAAKTLIKLDILKGYEDGSLKLDSTMTRAEFATVVVRMMGIMDAAESGQTATDFEDVAADYWASGYIQTASKAGIINGYGNGLFGPEETVTFEQAVKMIVDSLGYELLARQKGGYPTGYMVVASEKGILKNIDLKTNVQAVRGVIAQLIYNALETDMMEQDGFGETSQYSVEKGKTLLSDRLNFIKRTGQIEANADTTLVGESQLNKNEVQIDGSRYKVGDSGISDYLGYYVEFYAKKEDDDYTIVSFMLEKNKNETISVKADDISECRILDGNDMEIKYWKDKGEDSDAQTARISSKAYVIYNGKAADLTLDDFNFISPRNPSVKLFGDIHLIDTDEDGKFDCIFISAYDTMVVSSVSTSDHVIYIKYNTRNYAATSIILDPDDNSYDMKIIKDGKLAEFKDIAEWNVISYAESKNSGKRLKTIYISSDSLSGTISERSDDKVMIDGKEYELEKNLKEYLIPGKLAYDLSIGDQGTFYLDMDKKIAAYDLNLSGKNKYAFLFKVVQSSGVSKVVQFQLFTSSGDWSIFDGAEKIRHNGKLLQSEALYNLLTQGGVTQKQLVTFNVSSDNKVIELNTAGTNPKDTLRRGSAAGDTLTYLYENYSFNSQTFFDNNNIIVFVVPANSESQEDYAIVKASNYFIDDDMHKYTIYSYDENDYKVAKALVVMESTSTQVGDAVVEKNTCLVDKVNKVMEGDNEIIKLYGIQDKKQVALEIKDSVANDAKALQRGDMVQLRINAAGVVDGIYKFLAVSDLQNGTVASNVPVSTLNSDRIAVYGVVYDIDAGAKRMIINDIAGLKYFELSTNKSVYIYDLKRNRVAIGAIEDVQRGDYIAIRVRKTRAYDIVIYRFN